MTVIKQHSRAPIDGIAFAIKVVPKSRGDAIEGWVRDAGGGLLIKARVAAAPEGGKANAALIALLARAFTVPKKSVEIISGSAARIKRVRICGDRKALSARLGEFGEVS